MKNGQNGFGKKNKTLYMEGSKLSSTEKAGIVGKIEWIAPPVGGLSIASIKKSK